MEASKQGLHVVLAGRTQERLEEVASHIRNNGGEATPMVADTTDESQVRKLIENSERLGPCDLAIYNAGNNFPGEFLNMDASYFEDAWRVCTLGGFIFAKEVLRVMSERRTGTLIFTGASASMRGVCTVLPWTLRSPQPQLSTRM